MEKDVFCKIIEGKTDTKFLLENDDLIIFEDISPSAPVHYLVVPKKHIASLANIKKGDKNLLGALFLSVAEVVKKFKLGQNYKIIINGLDVGHVPHLHVHVLGGWLKKPSEKNLP